MLEVRISAGYRTVADVDEVFDKIDVEIAKLKPPQRVVTATDWRQCPINSSDAAERLSQRIALTNSRVARSSAIALPTSPTTVLQLMRLIREAGLSERRMFLNVEEQIAWLAEVLTPPEIARLREFLGAVDPRGRAAVRPG